MIHLREFKRASDKLDGVINATPLQYSETISKLAGNEVYMKPENLQKTGSFKIRGAYYKISELSAEEKMKGVVTSSSGNHGQAVAFAATMVGVKSVIVMPEDAPESKVNAARRYGADVLFYGRLPHERRARAMELVRQKGFIFIDDISDEKLITGQGTIGMEILDELHDADAVVAPIGGGALISGIAMAVKQIRPCAKVFGVQPIGAPSMYRAFKENRLVKLDKVDTVADGLRCARTHSATFRFVRKYVDDIFLVKDEEIVDALILLLERAKLLVELSGAVSIAAVLGGKIPLRSKKVVAVLSGGNIDLVKVANLITVNERS